MPTDNQYARRDIVQLDENGDYYIRHVSAMTDEGLHAKSDIAAELGWRDREIARLRTKLGMAQVHLRAADAMAEAVDRMIKANLLDPRSPVADARLDYSDPGAARAALESGDDDSD